MESLLPEQYEVYKRMTQGHNVFLSGKAGCGKSHILLAFYKFAKARNLKVVFLAPTGMAALALPEAMTVHRFFGFHPNSVFLHDDDIPMSDFLCNQLLHIDTIVVDEISMIRADIFYAMDISLRKHTGCFNRPFGGKQVIVVGDFNQLPPVIGDDKIFEIINYYFGGIYAFCSPVWKDLLFQNFFLTKVIRQTDQEFIDFLDAMRTMKPGLKNMLSSNSFRISACAEDEIVLCCSNKDAAEINNFRLAQIGSKYYYSHGIKSGYFPNADLPTDLNLALKQNARVMLIQNSRVSGCFRGQLYCNGDLGTVLAFDQNRQIASVKLDRGYIVNVSFTTWNNYQYDIFHDWKNTPILTVTSTGYFRQLPLKSAWATSIHKAQGQTLKKVHLCLGSGCFSPGQIYTALTRVRSFSDLTLDRSIQYGDLLVDPLVLSFYQDIFPHSH